MVSDSAHALSDVDAEPVSELAALAEQSPALQRMIIELAGRDMAAWDAEQAERISPVKRHQTNGEPAPPHVYLPNGKRQKKRRQRRLLFDALRRGAGRDQACHAAGIDPETLAAWMDRPEFAESVMQAEGYRHEEAWDEYDSTTWR